jgi:RHS repeat-associated protein
MVASTYDANGNMTSLQVESSAISRVTHFSYSWDHYNRLVRAVKTEGGVEQAVMENSYNHGDRRVTKWETKAGDGGQGVLYVTEGFEIRNTAEERYVYDGRQRVSRVGAVQPHVVPNGAENRVFVIGDHLGSNSIMVSDSAVSSSGCILGSSSYLPFGGIEAASDASCGVRDEETIRYTGKEMEVSFESYYFGARWLNPYIGRFYSVDVAALLGRNDPLRFSNCYVYAGNMPYSRLDPDGNEDFDLRGGMARLGDPAFRKRQKGPEDVVGNNLICGHQCHPVKASPFVNFKGNEQAYRLRYLVSVEIKIPDLWRKVIAAYARENPTYGAVLLDALRRNPVFLRSGKLPNYVNKDAGAITVDKTVYVDAPVWLTISLFVHELVHVSQYGRLGKAAFLTQYATESAGRWMRSKTNKGVDYETQKPFDIDKSNSLEDQAYHIGSHFKMWLDSELEVVPGKPRSEVGRMFDAEARKSRISENDRTAFYEQLKHAW